MANRKTAKGKSSFPHQQASCHHLVRMETEGNRLLEDPNAELLDALKKRTPEAFGMLIRLHERRLLGTAMKIIRNHEDAEDAVQNTFLQVHRFVDGFRGESLFTTWLTRILINQSLMLLRRRNNLMVSIDDCVADGAEAVPRDIKAPGHTPEESLLKREVSERLICALRNIRVQNRGVAELHYLEELSHDEIANILGISVPATKSRLLRARRQLRRDGPRQLEPTNHSPSTLYRKRQAARHTATVEGRKRMREESVEWRMRR